MNSQLRTTRICKWWHGVIKMSFILFSKTACVEKFFLGLMDTQKNLCSWNKQNFQNWHKKQNSCIIYNSYTLKIWRKWACYLNQFCLIHSLHNDVINSPAIKENITLYSRAPLRGMITAPLSFVSTHSFIFANLQKGFFFHLTLCHSQFKLQVLTIITDNNY